ncbi:phosphoribulokinase/uridine kinase [Xylariomycetidae sp. FL2044]|nr:phosphoribulokinase/uridine kinase [Xylariomycetidae sp. FL2044]
MEALMSSDESGMEKTIATLCARIRFLLKQNASRPRERILIALAGVPGSGKSTISAALLRTLALESSELKDEVAVVPMDGFHYAQSTLSTFDDPVTAFRRRGAPFTFDTEGLLSLVLALKATPVTTTAEPELTILAPSFDHAAKDPVSDGISIVSRTKVVIIEGNYTLYNEPPWNEIAGLVHDRWFVDVTPAIARGRLIERHLQAGIETSREAAASRAEENDIPNGDLIRSKLLKVDVRIVN